MLGSAVILAASADGQGSDVALFRPKCPVPPREQAWIEKMLLWCVDRFGDPPLRCPVVEPTAEFFPGDYLGTREDVLRTVDRVRAHLGISAERFTVEIAADDDPPGDLETMPTVPTRRAVVAGDYRRREGRGLVRIDPAQAGNRMRLVAVAAHELCHELLLGGGGIPGADGEDHEPLTDLVTVYTGFGVFTANAAFRVETLATGRRTSSLGYLTEAMFGYALGCYAWLRGETAPEPGWARFLDTNPHGYMRQSVRYLASNSGRALPHALAPPGFSPPPEQPDQREQAERPARRTGH